MTDQEQQVTPDSNNGEKQEAPAKFGSDQETTTPVFGKEDLEKVLKQNQHGQDHIRRLESETAEMREQIRQLQQELSNSRSIDELLSEIRQQNTESHEPGSTTPPVDENKLLEKLKSQVFADLSAAEQANLEQSNWQQSKTLLQERHGDGWASYVDSRAEELDMSIKDLESLAKTSPKAFIELVSPGQKPKGAVNPTQSTFKQAPVSGDDDFEVRIQRLSVLRRDLSTPEGRQANAEWNSPEFKARWAQHILAKRGN